MQDIQREPIAIIGIGCRFPGANNPHAFWQLLREGRSAIREVPSERWHIDTIYDPDAAQPGKTISRWGGFIDQIDGFDWRQFHMSPREAKYVDPQHRLLLEVAWEALEDAGLSLTHVAGSRTSVTIGISWNDYLRLQSRRWSQLNGYSVVGNPYSFAANRLSYFFNLRGSSLALDAGCTSSLASLHLACQTLLTGEATLALAGGVNLILSPDSMIMMSKAGLLAPDGRCKAFDAEADGCVRGEGAGIVVLKRLSQVEPSDRVYAIIRGITLNHNGHNEWIMGTSEAAQQMLLRDAYESVDIDPAEVDYVELHGTGFLRGDPVEARALGAVLGGSDKRQSPCLVGSLKTNMGNLESASGIASIIKVALSLYHREIPPTLNLQNVNPAIPLEELRLSPQLALEPWPEKAGIPLAAVNTLSFTGANGHAILAAAPQDTRIESAVEPERSTSTYLLPLSAGSKQALFAYALALRDFLRSEEALHSSWQDICYTASERRNHHPYRLAVISRSAQDGVAALDDFVQGKKSSALMGVSQEVAPGQKHKLVFLFAHQCEGGRWPISEDSFLWSEPTFRDIVEKCDQCFSEYTGRSLRDELRVPAGKALMKPAVVFTLQVAFASLWRSWGIEPDAVLGEGLGELAAAYVAGMLTLKDAMRLVAFSSAESAMREIWTRELAHLHLLPAQLPFYLTSVGLVDSGQSLAAHWFEHRYQRDLTVAVFDQLLADEYDVFVEPGSLSILSGAIFARLQHLERKGTIVPSLREGWDAQTSLLMGSGSLYSLGYMINWPALPMHTAGRIVSLPTYPWQRQRLWLDWLDIDEMSRSPEHEPTARQEAVAGRKIAAEQPLFVQQLKQAAPDRWKNLLLAHVTDQIVAILELDPAEPPDAEQQLFSLGMDSLTVTQLINRLQVSLERSLSPEVVFRCPTIGSLVDYMLQDMLPTKQTSAAAQSVVMLTRVKDLSEEEAEVLLLEKLALLEKLPIM